MDTKKLRQKILDLAIRGKLVPQDPNDESASVLLERIREEKGRLIKEGKIKRDKKKEISTSDKSHYENLPFEVPKSWVWCRLGEIALYKKGPFGSSITKSMFITKSYNTIKVYEQKNAIYKNAEIGNYYISSDKFNELKGFEVFPNDIIVSCAGTIGETFVMPSNIEKGIINQALMRIKLYDERILDFYLLYFDFILKNEVKEQGKGTAIKNIPPFDILKNFFIPLPPLVEQHRIVSKIEGCFALIDQIEENKISLSQFIKQAKSKVLDLAIRGKLVPQDPKESISNDELKITNKTADILHYPFEVPDEWRWVRITDISNLIQYGYTGSAIPFGKYKMLRITDIQNNSVDWETVPFVEIDDEKVENYLLSDNDILFARTGATVGKSFLIKNLNNKSVFASYLIRIQLEEKLNAQFVKYFFESGYYWEQIEDKSVGIGQPNVNGTLLSDMQIPIPPLDEQHRIVQKIETIFQTLDYIQNNL